MQYSAVSGGKNEAERVVIRRGILFMRNERIMVVVCSFSLRTVAFARISKDANMRSIVVDCTSP